MASFGITKSEILRNKKDITFLFKKGKTHFVFPFKVFYTANSMHNRVMVSVPKRNHKTAVARNLIKRRIKESYRIHKALTSDNGYIDIAIIYVSKDVLEFSRIDKSIATILSQLS